MTSVLTIDPVGAEDSGSYMCVAEYNNTGNLYVESDVGYVTVEGNISVTIPYL